ncbi:MAG: MBL fold metallo-hydrolase [Clostridia bacterium]|nr:MBL fold metallo-hydrolase [Clostridia bacterium]
MKIQSAEVGMIGTNFYVVTDEKTGVSFAVDTGADYSELENLLKGKNIKYILLTHGHYDHILGTAQAKKHTGAEVVIGCKDAECLYNETLSRAGLHFPGTQETLKADITVKDGDELRVGSIRIKVLETPGHTRGSVCFILPEQRVIFSGDTLFYQSIGRTDFPGSSYSDMENSLFKLRTLDGDYKVYPGHGMPTTLDFERKYNPFMCGG